MLLKRSKRAKDSIFPPVLSTQAKEEMRQALADILTGTVTGSPVHYAYPASATIVALTRMSAITFNEINPVLQGHYTFKLTERGAELLDRLSR